MNCYSAQNWTVALAYANTLASPSCGLSDSSAAGDWRLPNLNELKTLVDYSQHNPALPTGYPFTNVQLGSYWSSSTSALDTTYAWAANNPE